MKMKSILYLVLITLTTITIQTQSRTLLQSSSCSSSCGDIPVISYPFRLKGDPQTCGDHDYELSCENNKTTLNLYSATYLVKKISYNKHMIRLVDVNLSNGTCSLPSGSLSSDQIDRHDYRYRGAIVSFRSYTSFVRCSGQVMELGYATVPCESRNGSYVYAKYESGRSSLDLPESCELISVAPVDYFSVKNNHSYGDIVKALQSGFDLWWSVECRDCLESGDSCSIASFEDPVLYECSNNYGIATLVSSGIWLLLFGIHLIARFILVPIFLIGFFIYKCRTKRKSSSTTENVQQG